MSSTIDQQSINNQQSPIKMCFGDQQTSTKKYSLLTSYNIGN